MLKVGGKAVSAELLGLIGLLAFVLISTAAALSPSHYRDAAYLQGRSDVHPIFGGTRTARSDEWGVATPYFQIAVASGLGERDVVSPYHEPLKAFFALPSRDWSMAFKPDLWGFLLLDPARAFALHYAALAAAALLGTYLLLRQLGVRKEIAATTAGLVFFSHFVQGWWSSNAPVLALTLWPGVAFLWRARWWAKIPAIAVATAVLLIGELYPPFIVGGALAMAVSIAAFRSDTLNPRDLLIGAIGAAAGVAIALLHYGDLIPIMANTVYPGRHLSGGGELHLLQFAAQLFPYLTTQVYEPIPLWPTNTSEMAVVGSFLPLAMACFCPHPVLAQWAARHRRALLIWVAGLVVMAAWMLLPIPAQFAPILNLVAGPRLLWGFGLLLMSGLAVIAGKAEWRITGWRTTAFIAAVLGAWAVSKVGLAGGHLERHQLDWRVVPILLVLIGLGRLAPRVLKPRRVVLGALLLATLLTFGRFNPIQPAGPIFAPPPAAPVVDTLRAYAKANPKGSVVALGEYAAILNGLGIASVNHTLLRPELAFFHDAYPAMDAAAFNTLFNRYEHVMPDLVWAPTLVQGDVVAIPPDPFAIPLPVDYAAALAPPPPGEGKIDQAEATDLGAGRWGVIVGGWAGWLGVSPDQRLLVVLAPGAGRIVRATAFRLPRPDIPHSTERYAAGFGLRLEIETPDGAGPAAGALRVFARDAQGTWSLPQPVIKLAKSPRVVWPLPPGATPPLQPTD